MRLSYFALLAKAANSVGYKVKIEATEDTESWNVHLSPTIWKRVRNFLG
jgi:hypothetical protein